MLLQDIRHSLRFLRRTPGFSVVAIGVLALGIGANTAVFSLVNAMLLKPLPGRVGELVGVFNRDRVKVDRFRGFSYPAFTELRDHNDAFESLMAHTFALVGVRDGDSTRRTFAAVVSSNYFTTLGVPLAAGRGFSAEEERPGSAAPVVIVSDGLWRRSGKDPRFLGSTLTVNANVYTVIGITPQGFSGTMALASPDLWFPLGAFDHVVTDIFKQQPNGIDDRGSEALVIAGRLKPGLTLASAEPRLDAIARRLAEAYPATDRDRAFVLAKLQRLGTSTNPQSSNSLAAVSALLLVMAALVLVVACLNLANLLLARSAARRREMAIRLALGGSRLRIVRQLLTEGLLLSLAGAAAGLVLAWWTTSVLAASMSAVFPISIVIDAAPDARVFAAAGGFAVLSTIFFALGPAWAASGAELVTDLKSDTRAGSSRRGSRLVSGPALVVGQLAVSLALVTAGGLFVRGALNVAVIDPGFSLERELVVGVDASMAGYDEARARSTYRVLLERLRGLPGIEQASLASTVPFGEFSEGQLVRAADRKVQSIYQIVGAEYFKTLGLPMLRGREFSRLEEDASPRAATLAVVNEPLARKLFGDADPIGRPVQIGERERGTERTLEIVGVAPGLRHDIFDAAPVPQIYVASGGSYRGSMNLHLRITGSGPEAEAAMLDTVRREITRTDARLPIVSAKTMTGHRDTSILAWSVRVGAGLFSAFGILALLLATIGVYGLKAYDVSRRTREIGIRMALGATSGDVERLVMREGLRTTLIGLAVGLLFAAGIGRLLSGLLYRVSPFDPVVMTIAAVVLSAAALLACYFPARRATRIVPLEALRSE